MSVYIEQLITGGARRLGSSFIFPMAICPTYSSGRPSLSRSPVSKDMVVIAENGSGDSAAFTARSLPCSFR